MKALLVPVSLTSTTLNQRPSEKEFRSCDRERTILACTVGNLSWSYLSIPFVGDPRDLNFLPSHDGCSFLPGPASIRFAPNLLPRGSRWLFPPKIWNFAGVSRERRIPEQAHRMCVCVCVCVGQSWRQLTSCQENSLIWIFQLLVNLKIKKKVNVSETNVEHGISL